MSDIDDELLALAGGDSDGEGSMDGGRDMSASPPPKKKKAAAKKTKRRDRDDESEEEGEA
jgi:RNA polymerase-associated protein RTF1